MPNLMSDAKEDHLNIGELKKLSQRSNPKSNMFESSDKKRIENQPIQNPIRYQDILRN